MANDDRPLPRGWIREYDSASSHSFWVDTKATPPRSIWTHPLDDPQFLAENPDYRQEKGETNPKYRPPASPRPSSQGPVPWDDRLNQASGSKKRGFFGKIKDKAIGTKEEREAEKRRVQQMQEERRRQMLLRQQQYQQQQYQQYQQSPSVGYGAPYGQPGYGGYGGSAVYGPPAQPSRSGFGGGGIALPLIGGLAGGLLLGEALDGFDGGDFGDGGGDFGGGGF